MLTPCKNCFPELSYMLLLWRQEEQMVCKKNSCRNPEPFSLAEQRNLKKNSEQ